MSRWTGMLALVLAAGTAEAGPPLEITLTGTIEKSCSIAAASGTVDVGALDGAGSKQFGLDVSCNAPFSYDIEAQEGALVPASPIVYVGTFEDRIPYTLRFQLPLADGLPTAIDVTCTGAELADPSASCGSGDSGTAVAIDEQATVTLAWGAPAHPRLAGTHAETLTFTLQVRP